MGVESQHPGDHCQTREHFHQGEQESQHPGGHCQTRGHLHQGEQDVVHPAGEQVWCLWWGWKHCFVTGSVTWSRVDIILTFYLISV